MTASIEMFPAREGDCLLLTYSDGARKRRVLIDGGRAGTWTPLKAHLLALSPLERELELLVISHVDRDHIEGVLKMLSDDECPVTFKDIWFNGYGHLKAVDDEDFGAVMGEQLTELLLDGLAWNHTFGKRSVRIPQAGQPPIHELAGGLCLTLLSPTADKLLSLRPQWEKECQRAHILPSAELPPPPLPGEEPFGAIDVDALADEKFEEDDTVANGSSIALLADFPVRVDGTPGPRVLLGADAHPGVLLESLERLFPGDDRIPLDAFKVAHHGSRNNLSVELLDRLDCPRYLISTNGSYYKHPSRQAIARILKYGGDEKELVFNYPTAYTEIWDEASFAEDYGSRVTFGTQGYRRVDLP